MKRLILSLAVAAVAAGSPLAADYAFARDKDRGGGWEQNRGRGRGDDGPRRERRDPPRGGYERRDYERRGYEAPRGRAVRPGGYLPPDYRSAPVQDYPRYRLRPPPAGYAWRRTGDAFVLVDRYGQVFDIVPD